LVDFVDVGRVRGLRFFRKGAVSEPKQRFHISRAWSWPEGSCCSLRQRILGK
jgi:hypothetical protein